MLINNSVIVVLWWYLAKEKLLWNHQTEENQ